VLAIVTLVLVGPASAGKIKLSHRWNLGQIEIRCMNAEGNLTAGTGPGGYGCKTTKGEVSCTKDGACALALVRSAAHACSVPPSEGVLGRPYARQ
jgi:hypothetical protein